MGVCLGHTRNDKHTEQNVPELKPVYANHTEKAKFCVFYDFDLTIAVKHVFSESGGAQYPAFQRRFDTPDLIHFLGGEERIESLKTHFQKLLDMGCHLFIVSHGHIRVNVYVCIKLDLLKYFSGVYRPGDKSECIEHLLAQVRLPGNKALFIDDDENNVNLCMRVCPSIHIFPRAGMTSQHLSKIETMVAAALNEETPEEALIADTENVDENANDADLEVNESIESTTEKKEVENQEDQEDANTSSFQANDTGDNVALDDTADKEETEKEPVKDSGKVDGVSDKASENAEEAEVEFPS